MSTLSSKRVSKRYVVGRVDEQIDRMGGEKNRITNGDQNSVRHVHIGQIHVQNHAKRVDKIAQYVHEAVHESHGGKVALLVVDNFAIFRFDQTGQTSTGRVMFQHDQFVLLRHESFKLKS